MSESALNTSVEERLREFQTELEGLAFHGTLVAVSKVHPPARIQEAYQAGHRDFGENKVQELLDKQAQLPDDIRWHLIGHLQRNKVKSVVPWVHMIHSVDSDRLWKEIDKQAARIERPVEVLLQMHISQEESKFGFDQDELLALLEGGTLDERPHVVVRGLMGMATNTEDHAQIRQEFAGLRRFFERLRTAHFPERPEFDTLSMGMSGDYATAIEEGSNMIRVGSRIFGPRPYPKEA